MADRLTRVMIVDDEDVFCAHLTGILDWQSHGFYICAEARSGLEAVELIDDYNPDIVITDMQMPKGDGLLLIEHISKKYPHIQVIALSGYDEYDSVRGSMKHGALDYLLKHQINSAVLLEALNYANKRIDENNLKSATSEDFSKHAEIGLSELRRSVLREILSVGFVSKNELIKQTSHVGLDLSIGHFVIVVTEITQMNLHKSRYSDIEWMSIFGQMADMVERLLNDVGNRKNTAGFLLPEPENRFTLLFSMTKGYSYMHLNNYVITHIQSIRTALKRHFNFTANYSVSSHINDFRQLREKYKLTLNRLESNSYQGQDMIIREEKGVFDSVEPNYVKFDIDDETHIYSLLRDGQTDDLLAQINILFDRQRSIFAGSERLQMMFVELLSVLSRLARKEHIDTYELFPERDIYNRMRYMTIDEMKQFFLDAYGRFSELRTSHLCESSRELTQQACSYIRHNYKKPISLIDVADNVGVTPSYLSRIFKADTGKTVVEYINKARIEAAMRMIDDGVQLKGLAERVGFNSSNYFVTVFRQTTNKTPMQYKKTRNAE